MVHFSESFKSFLNEQANQGAVIARLIMSALNNQYAYPAYKKVLTTAEADFITMRPDGMVSYLPAGKEHKVNDRSTCTRLCTRPNEYRITSRSDTEGRKMRLMHSEARKQRVSVTATLKQFK